MNALKVRCAAFVLATMAVCVAFPQEGGNIAAFREARFGMFIHWGLYAQLGGSYRGVKMSEKIGEWIQSSLKIPNAEYSQLAKTFNPVDFNADDWACVAKKAGMEYVVLTTKHHEGFSMFATKASDYNVVDATPFGRDVFGELAAACRRQGLKVGLYYSQNLDWHEHDGGDPRNVKGTYPNGKMDWGNAWDWPDCSKKDFGRYLKAKVYPQVRELLTNYGEIFLVWFDTPMGMTPEQSRELREYVRSLQPNCLVNSRIGNGCGDFGSMGDNQLLSGKVDFPRESPITLNDTWGFRYDDHNWKEPYVVALFLAQNLACNANVLLNVGPRPDGRFPDATSDILSAIGEWRRRTGFVIRGTKPSPFPQPMPWGCCMVAPDNVLQLVVRREWKEDVVLEGVRNRVIASTVPYVLSGERLTVCLAPPTDLMPRVVRITLAGAPDIDQRLRPIAGRLGLSPTEGRLVVGPDPEDDKACKVSEAGTLDFWHHAGDGMVWKAYFPEAGRYTVRATVEDREKTLSRDCGRHVRLTAGGSRLEGRLIPSCSLETTVLARTECALGEIDVSAGEVEIAIENLRPCKDACGEFLMSLTLERLGESRLKKNEQ